MHEQSCRECRFFFPEDEYCGLGGECRRYPPVLSDAMFSDHVDEDVDEDHVFTNADKAMDSSVFPMVLCDSWCGEFRAKKPPLTRIPSVKEFMAAIEENRVHIHSTKAISGILNTQDDEPDFETNFWVDVVANRRWTWLDNVGPVTARYMDTILDKIRASE